MRQTSPSQIASPVLQELIAWYQSHTDGEAWPPKNAFKADRVPRAALDHVARVDVEVAPFRVYYRGVGRHLCEALGYDISRHYLDTLDIPQKADLMEWFRHSLSATGPIFIAGEQDVDGTPMLYESCCLPLGTAADDPRAFIIGEHIQKIEVWRSVVSTRMYGRFPTT